MVFLKPSIGTAYLRKFYSYGNVRISFRSSLKMKNENENENVDEKVQSCKYKVVRIKDLQYTYETLRFKITSFL